MRTAGYVLAGGASSRMGTNKAFLRFGERTLIEIVAGAVREAAGSVAIVGPADAFQGLGESVISDLRERAGPLGGLEAVLSHTEADWNLVVACDMPRVNAGSLRRILDEATGSRGFRCVLPVSGTDRVEPLCAAYHKSCLTLVSSALDAGLRKVTAAFPDEVVHYIRMNGDAMFQNVNTPEEWRVALEQH